MIRALEKWWGLRERVGLKRKGLGLKRKGEELKEKGGGA